MPTKRDWLPAECRKSLYSAGRKENRFQATRLFANYKPLIWLH